MHPIILEIFTALPRILVSIVIFLVFLVIASVVVKMIQRVADRNPPQRQPVFMVLTTFAKITILVIGAITTLGSAGVNVSALVASFGLSGLALSVAMKDAFANLLAGIMIILYQPFKIGDTIEMGELGGEVSRMSLRYTHLRSGHKEILIPNGSLLTNNIVVTHHG